MKTATLIGSTGLIGSHILDLLLKDQSFSSVRILVRRPVLITNPKLQTEVIDFNDLNAFKSGISGSNAAFCAVGTTNAKVNSRRRET